jgi:hypothetical protein
MRYWKEERRNAFTREMASLVDFTLLDFESESKPTF